MYSTERFFVGRFFKQMLVVNVLTALLIYYQPMSGGHKTAFITVIVAGDVLAIVVAIMMLRWAKNFRIKNNMVPKKK